MEIYKEVENEINTYQIVFISKDKEYESVDVKAMDVDDAISKAFNKINTNKYSSYRAYLLEKEDMCSDKEEK